MSAGWAPVARAPIAHKERVAALVDHPCRTRVGQRTGTGKPKDQPVPQRSTRSTPHLQPGPGLTFLRSRLMERIACRAMPGRRASLRGV